MLQEKTTDTKLHSGLLLGLLLASSAPSVLRCLTVTGIFLAEPEGEGQRRTGRKGQHKTGGWMRAQDDTELGGKPASEAS